MTHLPKLEIRSSSIAGKGCFALEDIPKGTMIGEYTGEIISDEEADKRYDESPDDVTYLFSIEGGKCIDATHETHALKYINHSCDPNCEADEEQGRIFYTTLQDIPKGTELTVDYRMVADDDDTQPCRCGSAHCRGTMKAPKEEEEEKAPQHEAKEPAQDP